MRITAILCVKNEGAFLLEWLAHHKAIGVTDVVVLSNDCDDGTDAMLDRLDEMGELSHIRNDGPYDQSGIQFTGLKRADKHPLVKDADWLVVLDIDEFVNVHVGDHSLPALIDALPDADAITLTWRMFGNSGVVDYRDRPVTEEFTRAAPEVMQWPWRAFLFKTLYRNNGAYRKLGVHRPRSPVDGRVEQARWFDGEGRELPAPFQRKQIFSPFGRKNYGLVQLNHYALGAMESYILKRHRGRVNRKLAPFGMDYWCDRNWSAVEDKSILSTQAARRDRIAMYRSDQQLAALHQNAVDWRKKTFQELMLEEENRALFGRLLMTPPARIIPSTLTSKLFEFGKISRKMSD